MRHRGGCRLPAATGLSKCAPRPLTSTLRLVHDTGRGRKESRLRRPIQGVKRLSWQQRTHLFSNGEFPLWARSQCSTVVPRSPARLPSAVVMLPRPTRRMSEREPTADFVGTPIAGRPAVLITTAHLERSKRRDVLDADPNSIRKIASLSISNLEAANVCSRTLIGGPVVLGTVNSIAG